MTRYKRTSVIILLFITLVLFAPILSNIELPARANVTDNAFDKTNILEDLSDIDLDKFQKDNESNGMQILTFVEYAYPYYANDKKHYALYIYIYNPQLLNIEIESRAHRIQMSSIKYAENEKAIDYDKFELKFLAKSEAPYRDKFYKFKVEDRSINNTYFYDRVTKEERIYNVSSVEIKEYSKPIIDYKVGITYGFSGYAKSYGQESDKMTLQITEKELTTIQLNVGQTEYRTGISSLGKGHQNDISTVYFGVDNSVLAKYGTLQKIKAEWYEYKTNDMIVTTDDDMYNAIYPYRGVDISDKTDDLKWWLAGTYYNPSPTVGIPFANWQYNHLPPVLIDAATPKKTYLTSIFKVNNLNDKISRNTIENYFNNYNSSYFNGRLSDVPGKENMSADLFLNTVDEGRKRGHETKEFDAKDTFNLLSYDSNHNGWQKFKDYFWSNKINTDEGYDNVMPIYEMKAEDRFAMDFKTRLLVEDEQDIKNYYDNAVGNNKKMFLFRFAVTDYYSQPVTYQKNTWLLPKDNAYSATQTVFLNFNIITLTFNKEGNYNTLPVVMSPIDIYKSATKPVDSGGDDILDLLERLKGYFNSLKEKGLEFVEIIKIIALVFITILIIYFIAKFIGAIANMINELKRNKNK